MANGSLNPNGCTVLFSASQGNGVTSGTLSADANTFSKIKIIFGNADGGYQNTVEFMPGLSQYTANNIPMVLYFPSTNSVQYHLRRLNLAADGVTFSTDRPLVAALSSSGVTISTSPNLVIYRIEGYK